MYSVPSHLLHISENDLQMLKLLGLGQRPQGKKDWREVSKGDLVIGEGTGTQSPQSC